MSGAEPQCVAKEGAEPPGRVGKIAGALVLAALAVGVGLLVDQYAPHTYFSILAALLVYSLADGVLVYNWGCAWASTSLFDRYRSGET